MVNGQVIFIEKMINKYNKVTLDKRKAERQCLPDFFKRHIEIAKTKCCEECGTKLKGHVSEIAHIVPKQYFKSVMCLDLNILYLCGMFSDRQCHANYDNFSQEKVKQMKIYNTVCSIFAEIKDKIIEPLNYKHYDLYT
jgi:hypothetical protein